jgi:hypothetical protein
VSELRLRSVLLPALLFGALGPPLGVLVFFASTLALSASTAKFSWQEFEIVEIATAWAYALATLPAALAGALLATLARRCQFANDRYRLRRLVTGALVGGAIAGIWQFATLYGKLSDPFFFIKAGAFAGALLAAFFPTRYWRVRPLTNGSSDRGAASPLSEGGSR